jgi:hypothetical protein
MRLMHRIAVRSLVAVGLLAAGLATAPAPQRIVAEPPPQAAENWSVVDDQWMVLEIGGSRVGWMNTLVDRSDDQFRTTTATEMTIGRGDAPVQIKMRTVFIETADGKPVQVTSLQHMAQQAVETTWEFAGDKIKQISKQGGRETASELDAPSVEWLTPHKADEYAKAQRKAGVTEFTFRTLDPQNGVKPITATSKHAGQTEFDVDGRKVPVQIWKTVTDVMPIEAAEYFDGDGELVYQEIPTGIGKITMRVASKDVALAKAAAGDGGAGGGQDIMLKSFARPDKPIENSFKASKAKFRLTAREGTLPDMPSAGAQRVEMSPDRKSAVLTVDIKDSLDASAAEIANEEFTEPSAMVDYRDEVVSKLADRADDETHTLAKAQELRSLVFKHISKKGMSTAFATASETARTRAGDCSEHGVLLAALLRSEDIPARVAMGLVYAPQFMGEEGIFGWHMWTQALIDGKWIDLDATLPVHYSAAHVLTATASLADGLGASSMASVVQLLGNLDIEVLEVEYAE